MHPKLMKIEIWDCWDPIQRTRVDEVTTSVGIFLILFVGSLESTFQIANDPLLGSYDPIHNSLVHEWIMVSW